MKLRVDVPAKRLAVEGDSEPNNPLQNKAKTTARPLILPGTAALEDNGLVKAAPKINPISGLPEGIKCVRKASPADADAISAIQAKYQLRSIDVADHPANGWLVQKSEPETIRFAMQRYKEFWVAEDDAGKIVAFQAVTPPRFISRPANLHKFFGSYGKRAQQVLASGNFIYMSQIATDPEHRKQGLAAALQAEVLKHFKGLPLVAHVAVFTQDDFDHWDHQSPFEPHSNNIISHKYHQKHGYLPVAWTSDLTGTTEYNSGLAAGKPQKDAPPPVCGMLYMNFQDGSEAVKRPYIDPVDAVLTSPCAPGEAASPEWQNPFSPFWPEKEFDMSGDWDFGFVPNFQGMYDFYMNKYIGELDALRSP
ncbi:MAG: GNAT family N-acetyltransferase [Myxococcota bacterium]